MPRSITSRSPYNYYPRGRVEIGKNRATVYLNPVLNESKATEHIYREFGFDSGNIPVRIIADGSVHYEYLIDYQPKCFSACGKTFDYWDNQED